MMFYLVFLILSIVTDAGKPLRGWQTYFPQHYCLSFCITMFTGAFVGSHLSLLMLLFNICYNKLGVLTTMNF